MDSVDYTFMSGALTSVGLSLTCDKYKTCNVDVIFQDIVKAIKNVYGKPYNISSRIYEDDDSIRNHGGIQKNDGIEWKLDDESIHITKWSNPKNSSISISIFSYQGYFIAIGPAHASAERQERGNVADPQKKTSEETNYNLSDGFRSLKWGTNIDDAKKIYSDLLFVEQIPGTDPKYYIYRKSNENKSISGTNWDRITYSFSKDKQFCSVDAESRYEVEEKIRY